MHNTPLSTASELVAQLGPQAEMLAGDHIEAALAANNQEDFQYWSLVAKAIVLLTRQPVTADSSKPASPAQARPTETPVHIPRRATA
ncbi:MAG: hypothetical protein ACXWLT_00075 [Rhizomicrobium sp.]